MFVELPVTAPSEATSPSGAQGTKVYHPAYTFGEGVFRAFSPLKRSSSAGVEGIGLGMIPRFLVLGLFGLILVLVLFLLLGNSKMPLVVGLCESAVQSKLAETEGREEASPVSVSGERSDIRFVGTPISGVNDTVIISGDYYSPNGTWVSFACAVEHKGETPQVKELSVDFISASP